MKSRHTFGFLALTATLLATPAAFGRGGETGTLDDEFETEDASLTAAIRVPVEGQYSRVRLKNESDYRRLCIRLEMQGRSVARVPGPEQYVVWRFDSRFYTVDGSKEILPPHD